MVKVRLFLDEVLLLLYLMSFLTEHCSTVIIQCLFSTAVFEHQLHSCLFPGKGDLLISEVNEQ